MKRPEYDGRNDGPVHGWFGLTYASYLVLQRSLMQAMPVEWQERIVACLNELRDATEGLKVNDNFTILLRDDRGHFARDPYCNYRHPKVTRIGDVKRKRKGAA